MHALATVLSQQGKLVTQIHFSGETPATWQHGDAGAALHSGAAVDMVVSTDGEVFKAGEVLA